MLLKLEISKIFLEPFLNFEFLQVLNTTTKETRRQRINDVYFYILPIDIPFNR